MVEATIWWRITATVGSQILIFMTHLAVAILVFSNQTLWLGAKCARFAEGHCMFMCVYIETIRKESYGTKTLYTIRSMRTGAMSVIYKQSMVSTQLCWWRWPWSKLSFSFVGPGCLHFLLSWRLAPKLSQFLPYSLKRPLQELHSALCHMKSFCRLLDQIWK